MNIHWVVQYNDGTRHDSDESGEGFKYQDIDRDRLTAFALLDGDRTVAVLHLNKGCRLIYRRRVTVNFRNEKEAVFLFGWQKTVGNGFGQITNEQVINVLFEDGHIETVDRWIENSKWFDLPNLRPEEK